jgi:hypothetical protein
MLDSYKFAEEIRDDMLEYFKVFELATFQEPTESVLKDLPSCFMQPVSAVARGLTDYNGTEEQATEDHVAFIIFCKVEDLYHARKHLNKVVRASGRVPNPEQIDIPNHAMKYVSGDIVLIRGSTYHWTEVYNTYSLGGV